ncbi:MAG: 1-acyl-sn-glycerol-3-phosphate acyltransferase [Sphingobacteriales bacterium 41-5]|nr:MAG: glycerol acyltransferase [Niabella sp. SCN 42-15]OJU25903.1 MAG: 1-acyl-sn-glycerol-3-phosphate acyltransferase [Sphingobacteriales bacterium 41-5]
MKILKENGGRLWALWGLITFIITFAIVFLPSMLAYIIPDPKGTDYFIKLARLWMRVWLFLVGCPLKVKGTENFQKGKTYIVTCNHNSILDPPLSCPFIPGPNKTIAKDSYAKIPLFGWYYARGSVLINRKSEESRKESYDKMQEVLKKGMHMSIYPEGTRNRTSAPLKKFYSGAFHLAEQSQHEIIPAILFNTKKALPFGKPFYLLPKKLEIHFLQPVSVAGKSASELKEEVYGVMERYIITHQ